MRTKGIFAALFAVASMVKSGLRFGARREKLGGKARQSGMFNLSGLPPAWKGRRMRKIMRGGK